MDISIKGFISPKESELYDDCADRYAINLEEAKFAVSDGVSRSFFPKIWAEVLVNYWVQSKDFEDNNVIEQCQKKWLDIVSKIVNKPDTKWFTKNAYNRNESGLATFVGLWFFEKKKNWYWKAFALGDSFLFFLPKGFMSFDKEIILLSSKPDPVTFDNYPDYFSSRGGHKGEKKIVEETLCEGTFYLMTDALAEWFLTEKENAINKISAWKNQTYFELFVTEERYNNKLQNDDYAILIIRVEDNGKNNLNFISEDITNINTLINE